LGHVLAAGPIAAGKAYAGRDHVGMAKVIVLGWGARSAGDVAGTGRLLGCAKHQSFLDILMIFHALCRARNSSHEA